MNVGGDTNSTTMGVGEAQALLVENKKHYMHALNRVPLHMSSFTTGDLEFMLHCMCTMYNDTTNLVLHVDLSTPIQ